MRKQQKLSFKWYSIINVRVKENGEINTSCKTQQDTKGNTCCIFLSTLYSGRISKLAVEQHTIIVRPFSQQQHLLCRSDRGPLWSLDTTEDSRLGQISILPLLFCQNPEPYLFSFLNDASQWLTHALVQWLLRCSRQWVNSGSSKHSLGNTIIG